MGAQRFRNEEGNGQERVRLDQLAKLVKSLGDSQRVWRVEKWGGRHLDTATG